VILDIEAKKTSRKVTDIEISFEYKNNKKRIERDAKKREKFVKAIIDIIHDQYIGKSIKTKEYGILICENARYEKEKDQIIMSCSDKDNFNKKVDFIMKDFNGLKMLEKCHNDALSEFYINEFFKNDINGIFDEEAIKKLFNIK